MYSQGHTQESFDSLPLADRMALLRWFCHGFIGPYGEAQRTFMRVISSGFMKKAPDFDKLFPFHALQMEGVSGLTEEQVANAKAIEGLINMQAEMEAADAGGKS